MNRIIKIQIHSHRKTGLLMATSSDMPGLVVHGRSEDDLKQKLPGAVQDLLEAAGHEVTYVSVVVDEDRTIPEFGPAAFIASASLAACAQQ